MLLNEWFGKVSSANVVAGIPIAISRRKSAVGSCSVLDDSLSAHESTEVEFLLWLPRIDDPLLFQRLDSYRRLVRNHELRRKFVDVFLAHVFNVADPGEVLRVMSKEVWDSVNEDDVSIYKAIREHFQVNASPTGQLMQGWRGIPQLNRFDVAEIVSAYFGYGSLTSSLTDVIQEMRLLHADSQRHL
jgi:hypothetical protein